MYSPQTGRIVVYCCDHFYNFLQFYGSISIENLYYFIKNTNKTQTYNQK